MNPIELSDHLQKTFVKYLMTTFNVNRDGKQRELATELRNCFDAPHALFNGPYLELTPPYETGRTLSELAAERIIDPRLLKLPCFKDGNPIPVNVPLYQHQEQAVTKLCQQERNIVVSSGTGSGKTECFLLPILNDLVANPEPGVRAVLIYPMNALVNDQLDRLRKLLAGTNITFGRYTGETPHKEKAARKALGRDPLPNEIYYRDQIRNEGQLPQILITNYAMLEYLLLRPDDAPLFQSGAWKYIVLDEAHSYAGAQGIEVSYLLQRLKHRLGKKAGATRCIATSATLTSDDADMAVQFAQNLFGEKFETEDVIFGKTDLTYVKSDGRGKRHSAETLLHPQFDALLTEVRYASAGDTTTIALRMEEIGLIGAEMLNQADQFETPSQFLWHVLQNDGDLHHLRHWMGQKHGEPVSMQDAATELFSERIVDEPDRVHALHHIVELGAMARPAPNKTSLLPARYHLFARPPQGVWVCLNPRCVGRRHSQTPWSQLFSIHREHCPDCQCAVYPLHVCRTCGQTYLRIEQDAETREWKAEVNPLSRPEVRYLTWSHVDENLALAEDDEEEADNTQKVQQSAETLCLRCQHIPTNGHCKCAGDAVHVQFFTVVKPNRPKRASARKKVKVNLQPVDKLQQCCRCRDKGIRDTEVATAVSMNGNTPLAVITSHLYRQLPKAAKASAHRKPGSGRKLLTFYDSRQGAARFAAFLQDISTLEMYRHLIPESIKQYVQEQTHLPDFIELETKFVDIGWKQRVFHSDVTLEDFTSKLDRPSSPQRKRLLDKVRARLLAEFSTRRKMRQSVESLGIVAVRYFDDDHLPDFAQLAQTINLDVPQTYSLVTRLLDQLRSEKVITLPQGVARDDEAFGRNVGDLYLVRQDNGKNEVTWTGKLERHRRRRMIRELYAHVGKPIREAQIVEVLFAIYDWLVHDSTLLKGSPQLGYKLNHTQWRFQLDAAWYRCGTCRRLTARGGAIMLCPHSHCDGMLHEAQVTRAGNYYYENLTETLVPMRVEEHTAQLETDKGREYQASFKAGDINVLSCSTTFEMGIDLGDLEAVVLSNIPPSVSNYKQRAGRAGRRASGTAFILAWAANRPHDQTHFADPRNIIGGRVRVPHIEVANREIFQRHINAILLSAFLRYRAREFDSLTYVGPFFGAQGVASESHYTALQAWLQAESEKLVALLKLFPSIAKFNKPAMLVEIFAADIQKKAADYYNMVSNHYHRKIKEAKFALIDAMDENDEKAEKRASLDRKRYQRLLKRLNEKTFLINFLSERGVLPSYSFPLHTVNLQVQREAKLRLQRDVRLAIREYAPGQEIVADKRIWRSDALNFYGEEPRISKYRICRHCNRLQISKAEGFELENKCPTCGEIPSKAQRGLVEFIIPDDFRSESKGEPARQYVHRVANLMRSALLPSEISEMQTLGDVLRYGYDRDGELLYVNEGHVGLGFKICRVCGTSVEDKKARQCTNKRCESRQLRSYALGFRETTDTLHLEFQSLPNCPVPDPGDNRFWWSLLYALLMGACRVLQIERRDINAVLFPRNTADGYQQTVVLYDDVPGGAGHVRRIMTHLKDVVSEALTVVNCENCSQETSCVRCLRDYNNQWQWNLLTRGPVVRYLEAIQASLNPIDEQGSAPIVVLHHARWLMQALRSASHTISISAEAITSHVPTGERQTWLDILQEASVRGVHIDLVLNQLPDPTANSKTLIDAYHLRLLLERGVNVWQSDRQPMWPICIDAGMSSGRVIRPENPQSIVLDDSIGEDGLVQSIKPDFVKGLNRVLLSQRKRPVRAEELELPPAIQVREVRRGVATSERELVGDLFDRPIVRLHINDRYLFEEDVIKLRVGAYIEMAAAHGALKHVRIHTYRAGYEGRLRQKSTRVQRNAFNWLERKFRIELECSYHKPDHDRSIVIDYSDGTRTRIQIGRGLDFIEDGYATDNTSLIIEQGY